MKISIIAFLFISVALLNLSCREKNKKNVSRTSEAQATARSEPVEESKIANNLRSAGAGGGSPGPWRTSENPSFAMNSDRMSESQRLELRQSLPKGYLIGPSITPRTVSGIADKIEWHKVGEKNCNPGNKENMARVLGVDVAKIPAGVRGDDWVLKSTSGQRVLVQSGGNSDRATLFEAKGGIVDGSSGKKVHCINFDVQRRTFIFWDSFVNDSLIIGHLVDDEDLEDLPSRHILYCYDLDKMILQRFSLPEVVQETEAESFVIDSVAPSAILVRFDKNQELVTVFLDN